MRFLPLVFSIFYSSVPNFFFFRFSLRSAVTSMNGGNKENRLKHGAAKIKRLPSDGWRIETYILRVERSISLPTGKKAEAFDVTAEETDVYFYCHLPN